MLACHDALCCLLIISKDAGSHTLELQTAAKEAVMSRSPREDTPELMVTWHRSLPWSRERHT